MGSAAAVDAAASRSRAGCIARDARTTCAASGSPQLGGNSGSSRAGLGRAAPCRASGARTGSCASRGTPASASGRRSSGTGATGAIGADLGISSGRVSAARSACSRRVGTPAIAFVGRCAAGRAKARSRGDRLGIARRKRSA